MHVSHKSITPLPHEVGQKMFVQMYEQELFQLFSQASHFSRSVFTSQSQQYG
ncbi:hypothetical protein IJ913_00380 [bacterium]|nr:hypothetical protein [bacterium]